MGSPGVVLTAVSDGERADDGGAEYHYFHLCY